VSEEVRASEDQIIDEMIEIGNKATQPYRAPQPLVKPKVETPLHRLGYVGLVLTPLAIIAAVALILNPVLLLIGLLYALIGLVFGLIYTEESKLPIKQSVLRTAWWPVFFICVAAKYSWLGLRSLALWVKYGDQQ
jgi:energy-coupling factor transporter transmembrane protein EcfT